MSYQGQNPNQDPYSNSGEYGQGYTPQQQPANPSTGEQSDNQYYQPGNTQQSGNPYYQPGAGSQYQQPPNYGQPPYGQQQYNAPQSSSFTTLGIDPRIESVLCYALFWITGLIFFFVEKQNRQVRFHAMQSIIIFGGLSILSWIVGWLPFIGAVLGSLIFFVTIVAWIGLMVMAYTNNSYRIPYISDYADRYTDQIKI
jgi:uncharacterized membrane protein